ncbi:MAG: deoxyguanosinetriphosphate triphosphohydrolase [bacterium]|nr:deoxyguanosinetriphosphate triphosphohydrolase [bacterium]
MKTVNSLMQDEKSHLAPFASLSCESKGRKHEIKDSAHRTPFQRDRDRIVHSTAFRRLEYKTQVFVNHEADYYRTRLTHTIEVAQIGRSMAKSLRLNEDLTEAIALAHDIGHTPFGHAGERALHDLMEKHGGFEHNSQSLRVVDYLEERYAEYRGLNLTWEVREGIIKHHTSYDNPDKSLLKDFLPGKSSSLEAQIVNIADEIAYNNHDIDDGLESDLIKIEELLDIPLFKECFDRCRKKVRNEKILRFEIVRELIGAQINDAIVSSINRINEKNIKSLDDVRNSEILIDYSPEMKKKNIELKKHLYENLYKNYKVLKMQHKAERYIEKLFRAYEEDIRQLPPKFFDEVKSQGEKRVIADYIAGMTDRYAQDEYGRLFLPYERM